MTEVQKSAWSWTRLRARVSAPLLFCSLLLNVVLGSYLAVQALIAEPQPLRLRPPQQMLATLADQLPSKDAEILREILRAKAPQFLTAQAATQRGRARVVSVLARPELDMDLLRLAFKDLIEKRANMGGLVIETTIEAMGRISPESRQTLVEQYRSR
jgi:uncharacterized membrane protein